MRIIQLKNRTPSQMTGFIVVTEDGHIVVIDGGVQGDTDGFLEVLARAAAEHGIENRIDLWLLTHPHDDHFGVFARFSRRLRMGEKLPEVVDFRYFPLPDDFAISEHPFNACQLPELNAELAVTPLPVNVMKKGMHFTFGDLDIEVLRVTNHNITANAFNNASCVLMLTERREGKEPFKAVFLGDLGVEGGRELLAMYGGGLKADAVQMAHHGQNGVEREVYEAIAPRYAFWTTPDWLWTNTIPGLEPGKGPWQTLEVRSWMEALNAFPVRACADDMELDTLSETVREYK